MRTAEAGIPGRMRRMMSGLARRWLLLHCARRRGELKYPAGPDHGRIPENIAAAHRVPDVELDNLWIQISVTEVALGYRPQALTRTDDDRLVGSHAHHLRNCWRTGGLPGGTIGAGAAGPRIMIPRTQGRGTAANGVAGSGVAGQGVTRRGRPGSGWPAGQGHGTGPRYLGEGHRMARD